MRCLFVPTPTPNLYRCSRPDCDLVVQSPHPPEKIFAQCKATPKRYAIVPWRKRAWRFLRSMWKWGKKRFQRVSEGELTRRMTACARCDARKGHQCQPCGCYLPLKQVMATEGCTLGLWEKTCDNGCGQ